MPDPRPIPSFSESDSHDYPPAGPESDPAARRSRLQRALQNTTELAREVASMVEHESRWRRNRVDSGQQTNLGWSSSRRRQRPDDSEETTDTPNDDDERRRRVKRRKTEDSSTAVKSAIRYGHYGQVEPGRLQMELISCDGGEHVDSRHPHMYLGAKNVLKHDKSVYCSASPSSTIVLKHADDTPFCLEKLHIIGPDNGFTAPVRHGTVYVAMDLHSLQKYTDPVIPPHARRTPTNPNGAHRRPQAESRRRPPERLSLIAALQDPDIGAALSQRERGAAQTALLRDLTPEHDPESPDAEAAGAPCEVPLFEQEEDLMAMHGIESARPTTVLTDEEPGPEESSSQSVLEFRLQRYRLMRRRYEIETWDREGRYTAEYPDDPSQQARRHHSDHAVQAPPSTKTTAPDNSVTCAKFSIHRYDHRVAIKFEPEVSGRFIMLKLSADRANVDVQSIIAKGYGGQRFFPAREFR